MCQHRPDCLVRDTDKCSWAAESIEQVAILSYVLASVISAMVRHHTDLLRTVSGPLLMVVQLYLPRTYSTSQGGDLNVMVGGHNRGGNEAVSHALMSLMREGGQWDPSDDKRAGIGASTAALVKDESDDDEYVLEGQRNFAVSTSLPSTLGSYPCGINADHTSA